jgi:hypothetical protein
LHKFPVKEVIMDVKKCSKCALEKHFNDFYKKKSGLNGLHAQCKDCFRLRTKLFSEQNRERKKEIDRKYYQKSKQAKSVSNRAWREENPNYFKEYRLQKSKLHEKKVDYGADSESTGLNSRG